MTPAAVPFVAERSRTVPIAFIQTILHGFAKYGVDPSELLRRTQITPEVLRLPGARITRHQFEAFANGAMHRLDDEAVGLFSRRLPWGAFGMLCRASLTAPTLRVALQRWFRHHRLLIDDVAFRLDLDGAKASVVISESRDLGPCRDLACVSHLKVVHGFASWLIDSRIPLDQVVFPYPPPPHARVYDLYFPGPVSYGGGQARLSFDASYLALPVVRDEQALQRLLKRPLSITVVQYRRDRRLAERVRERLALCLADDASAEAVAHALNLSLRTLHRHLRAEGASFLAIKDDLRRERALALLARPSLSIKVVAGKLGFADSKAFARAFKQWTGEPPRRFRGGG